MKKLATLVFALMLTASLSFAQAGGTAGAAPAQTDTTKSDSGKKAHKGGKKGHKGGKKSKKGASTDAAAPATPK